MNLLRSLDYYCYCRLAGAKLCLFFFSFEFFFFFEGLRIWRWCFDAFSAPGLQSNFLTELCSERQLCLGMEICNWE